MKASIYSTYGGPEVLKIQEVTKPFPGADEILIKVFATSVTAGDARMRSFNVPRSQWIFARLYLGLWNPRRPVLGMELSGTVEAVGRNVTRFKVGDEVFASTLHAGFGAYAEYKCMSEHAAVTRKPSNLNFLEAATLPIGAGTALRFLRNADLEKGKKVLVYGASGSVGTYAVQIAKYYGADVTAVCSTAGIGIAKVLGPDNIIDYSIDPVDSLGRYDLVFDAVGKTNSSQIKSALKVKGKVLSVKDNPGKITTEDLRELRELAESNVIWPVITDYYELENVAEAHRLVDGGHKKGNVSIVVSY